MAYKEPEIVRTADIQVKSFSFNSFGDLLFLDTNDKEYKIAKKREKLFPVIENGTNVRLGYAFYMNNEYIATVEPCGSPQAVVPPKPKETPEQAKPLVKEPTRTSDPAPQAVGMVTNNIGQLIISEKLVEIFGDKISKNLIAWYRSQVLGITKVEFDGKDLPK